MFAYIVLIFSAFSCISAQIVTDCQYIPGKSDFNTTKALGEWYEFKTYPLKHQKNWKRVKDSFSFAYDGKIIMRNQGINKKTGYEEVSIITITPDIDVRKGGLTSSFSLKNIDSSLGNEEIPCQVLGSDYECFNLVLCSKPVKAVKTLETVEAVEYKCVETAWIHTRKPVPGECCKEVIDKTLADVGINQELFVAIDQSV